MLRENSETISQLFQISFLRWQKDDCSKEKLSFKNNNIVSVVGNKYILIAFPVGLAILHWWTWTLVGGLLVSFGKRTLSWRSFHEFTLIDQTLCDLPY